MSMDVFQLRLDNCLTLIDAFRFRFVHFHLEIKIREIICFGKCCVLSSALRDDRFASLLSLSLSMGARDNNIIFYRSPLREKDTSRESEVAGISYFSLFSEHQKKITRRRERDKKSSEIIKHTSSLPPYNLRTTSIQVSLALEMGSLGNAFLFMDSDVKEIQGLSRQIEFIPWPTPKPSYK